MGFFSKGALVNAGGGAVTGAMTGGWAGALAGATTGLVDAYNTNSANKYAEKQADKQRSWTKMMSDTAHQREVADLKAAGINPLLTATGGNGASTPNSAAAQTFMANPDLVGAANSATRKKEQEQQLKQIEANVENQTRDSKNYEELVQKQGEEIDKRKEQIDQEIEESRQRAMAHHYQGLMNKLEAMVLARTGPKRVHAINSANSLSARRDDLFDNDLGDLIFATGTTANSVGNMFGAAINAKTAVSDRRIKGYNYYDKNGKYKGSRENVY